MGKLYVLNAGNADSFVLKLESEEGYRYVIIDGGDRKRGSPLSAFLEKMEISNLEAVIITHLHQDHLGRLPEITSCLPVKTLVVPYPSISVEQRYIELFYQETPDKIAQKVDELSAYDRMIAKLRGRGTKILTSFSEHCNHIKIGEYSLRQLYPLPGMSSEIYGIISGKRTNGIPDPKERKRFQDGINGDSSIWLLERQGEPLIYFAGDAVLTSQWKTLEKRLLHPRVLKLSHHGVNSKGKIYYSKELINILSPKTLIITNDCRGAAEWGELWNEAACGAEIMISGLMQAVGEIDL